MKFACFSDTHGGRPSVDLEFSDLDGVLHAGDLYDRLSMGMTPTALENVDQWGFSKEKLRIVRGNHDVLDPSDIFKTCDLSGRIEEVRQDLFLVGIGWHGQHCYDLPRERDLAPICQGLFRQARLKIPNGAHTIILTHYPAYMPDLFPDKHQGGLRRIGKKPEGWFFDCIAKAVEAFRPIAVVQGHIHGLMGATGTKDGTLVFFPGHRGGLLTVDIQSASAEFKSF